MSNMINFEGEEYFDAETSAKLLEAINAQIAAGAEEIDVEGLVEEVTSQEEGEEYDWQWYAHNCPQANY